MKNSILIVLGFFTSLVSFAQTPWVRTYGGPNEEKGYSLILAPDSGFYVVGFTGSFGAGSTDMYIIKTDSLGQFQWQKTIGTANIDIAEDIIYANNPGEYFIAGYSNGFYPYEYNFYFAKIDANGDTIRTNNAGTAEWDLCHAAVATGDGYLMVGESYYLSNGGTHGYLMKVNENLDTLKTYLHYTNEYTVFNDIIAVSSNKYLVVGNSYNEAKDSSDAMIWLFNGDGDLLQELRIDYGKNEYLNCAAASYGNGIMLGGYYHYDSTKFSKSLQIKLSDSADVVDWYLMAPEADDYGLEITDYAHYGNDAFILSGESRYKYNDDHQAVIIRSYPDGYPVFNKESGILLIIDGFFGIARAHDNGIIATGYTRSYGPGIQALMISKFGEWGATYNGAIVSNEEKEIETWKIYPNPTHNYLYIEAKSDAQIRILDMTGNVVTNAKITGAGVHSISVENLASGVYNLQILSSDYAISHTKFVKN